MERTKILKLLKSEAALEKVLIKGWVRTRSLFLKSTTAHV